LVGFLIIYINGAVSKHFLGDFEKLRKRLLALSCLSVCLSLRPSVSPPVGMQKLGFFWTEFHEIWHLSIFKHLSRNVKLDRKVTSTMVRYKKTYANLKNIWLISC
jgi:hypothetical protein